MLKATIQNIFMQNHQEIKISQGVYFTDFRKDKPLIGISQINKQQSKDVKILLEDAKQLQTKIQQLIYTIKMIEEQQNWEIDQDFVETIHQDYPLILKYSSELIALALKIKQLGFHVNTQQLE